MTKDAARKPRQDKSGTTYEANYGNATPEQVAAAVLRYRPSKQAAPPPPPEKRR